MLIEQLDKFHQAQPFMPFRIVMSDGRTLYVPHPEYLARSPHGRTVCVFDVEDGGFEVIDLLHVAGVKITGKDEPRWPADSETNSFTSEQGPR